MLKQLKNPPPTPALILLDINMPGYSGLQILEMIRNNSDWQSIPVIMFTTSTGEENIVASKSLGATYYLPKSPDYDDLKKSIAYVAEREWNAEATGSFEFVHQ